MNGSLEEPFETWHNMTDRQTFLDRNLKVTTCLWLALSPTSAPGMRYVPKTLERLKSGSASHGWLFDFEVGSLTSSRRKSPSHETITQSFNMFLRTHSLPLFLIVRARPVTGTYNFAFDDCHILFPFISIFPPSLTDLLINITGKKGKENNQV